MVKHLHVSRARLAGGRAGMLLVVLFLVASLAAQGAVLFLSLESEEEPATCGIEFVESVPQQMDFGNVTKTYEAWLEMINGAKETLVIGQYYWTLTDGDEAHEGDIGMEVFAAVRSAGLRGVNVTIVQNALADSMPGTETQQLVDEGLAQVRTIDFSKFGTAGIFHTKMIIVDGKTFYVGSTNMDWRSLVQVKEMGIVVKNCPVLAADLQKVFDGVWKVADDGNVLPETWPKEMDTQFNADNRAFINVEGRENPAEVYIAVSPKSFCPDSRTDVTEATLRMIENAATHVYIEVMDYFPVTLYQDVNEYWGVIDDALRAAAFRGVQVHLLVGHWSHTKPTAYPYLKSLDVLTNIEVRWYQVPALVDLEEVPYSRVNHAKYMVTDTETYVSTNNWSADYFTNTHGVVVISTSPDLALDLRSRFIRDWESNYSFPIDYFNA